MPNRMGLPQSQRFTALALQGLQQVFLSDQWHALRARENAAP